MITVVIPVLNESESVSSVIELAARSAGVTEILVVDDGSIDGTPDVARAAGARVLTSTLLGKGASMEDGVKAAGNELIVFLDGDLCGLGPDLIERMTAPLVADQADFVKARFARAAGRVTILTARPLLQTFFPELSHIDQPLGGIVAARRSLLARLPFETDYGVDVGLLLDAAATGARLAEVDIGSLEHVSHPLEVLGDMATQVARVILRRAARCGRLELDQVREVDEIERHSKAELEVILRSVGRPQRLALFDMDGTLIKDRFVVRLAQRTHKGQELLGLLDHGALGPSERTRQIAALFAEVPRKVFEEVARDIPLMPGAAAAVIGLRRAGYRVGLVSDSFLIATEVVRRRVFADFSIAHLLRFRGGRATGEVRLCPTMTHPGGCSQHEICKLNVMLHLNAHLALAPADILAVGDNEPDVCLMEAAGLAIAVEPKTAAVAAAARHVVQRDLREVLPWAVGRDARSPVGTGSGPVTGP